MSYGGLVVILLWAIFAFVDQKVKIRESKQKGLLLASKIRLHGLLVGGLLLLWLNDWKCPPK
jgi:hypothetical protein